MATNNKKTTNNLEELENLLGSYFGDMSNMTQSPFMNIPQTPPQQPLGGILPMPPYGGNPFKGVPPMGMGAPTTSPIGNAPNPFANPMMTNPDMALSKLYCDSTVTLRAMLSPEELTILIKAKKLLLTEDEKHLARWNFQELNPLDENKTLPGIYHDENNDEDESTVRHTGETFKHKPYNPEDMQRIISELQDYIYEMRFMEDISENNENKKLSYVIGEVSVAFEQIKKALIPLYKELRENHEKELRNIQIHNFGCEMTNAKHKNSKKENDIK